MLKAGIMGFGGVGQGMAQILRDRGLAQVVGVCDIEAAKLALAREKLGLKATKDPRELCSWDIDFVVVASTNYAHQEHVLAAAEAGKHVLCEKPPALSLRGLDEMIEATEKRKLVTIVNYGRRLDPAYIRMKDMIDSGEIGKVLSVTCFSSRGWGLAVHGNPHPAVAHPDKSGGWLLHHACHIIDYAVWLAGPAKTAYCRSGTTVAKGDSCEVLWGILEHEGGALGVVGDTVAAFRQQTVTIIGTKATLELTRTPTGEVMHMRRETGREFPYFEDIIGYGTFWHHEATLRELIACIEKGSKCPHDLRSTRNSLVAALALEESRRTGKIVPTTAIGGKR
jgi:predicted dehydrogenase